MDTGRYLTFASEAELLALWGLGMMALSAFAGFMEWRQGKRASLDRVGMVPWLPVCLLSAMIGFGILVLAIKGWNAP